MAITPVQGKQIATASWAINALTASYLEGYISPFPFTGSAQITGSLGVTGSLNVTQGITGSLFGTASFAVSSSRAVTSSFAISSSFATTASFAVSSSRAVTSSFAISSSQATSASWAPLNAGGSNTQIQFNSGSRLSGIDSFTFNYSKESLQQGSAVTANGLYSHAEGYDTQTIGNYGDYSHAEGYSTQAIGQASHAEGITTKTGIENAYQVDQVSSGRVTVSSNYGDVTTYFTPGGYLYLYDSEFDNAFGYTSSIIDTVTFNGTETEIQLLDTSINTSTAYVGDVTYLATNGTFGGSKIIPGSYSHAEGNTTFAIGPSSHAEGSNTQALGNQSHVEGYNTTALGKYQHVQGQYNIPSEVQSAFIHGNGTDDSNRSNLIYAHDSIVEITGSLDVTGGITGNLSGNATTATNATSASYSLSSSFAVSSSRAVSSSFAITSSFAQTASFAPNYLPLTGGTINGNVTINGTASIAFLNVTIESASVIYSSGSNQFGDATNDTQTLIGTVLISGSQRITGSLNVSQGITGSLFGTSSYAINAATASNILGGKAPHIPFFITDTTLATSSLYQSGSSTVIINQDNATTANPEALYVWQPHPTSFNVISGKGNINNYLQLNIQNTNQGANASSDVVATADNGDETTNYIDMGINGENYTGVLGGPNDGYLYSTGIHLHIGNATPNQYVGFFAGGDDVDTNMKLVLDANNQHQITGSLEISGSLNVRNNLTSSGLLTNGTNTIVGNTVMSGSSTIQGNATMTGSLLITGSTTQVGNNTLLGNTVLSGSIVISGSIAPGNLSASVNIYGDTAMSGFLRFNPYSTNIDTSISASYIFVSGSTNDLYFSQNGSGYANTTRLRWLEGNLYTGLLNGALITTASSTTFNISSGSGVVVSLNASLNDNPYPTVKYVNWGNLTNQTLLYRTSSVQTFVGIDSNGQIIQQVDPWTDGQYNTSISIGTVIHQNQNTINATITYPNVAYGYKQRTYDFIKAFGPLKLSGFTLAVSGSSTGSLVVGSGTAFADGRNYQTDPNNPSYITDPGTAVSKIFRYYQSGSTFVQDTNSALGYEAIDPANYNNNGTLTPVPGTGANREWSIQRVFWYPNSATKGIVVYYGNTTYISEVDAAANIQYETFNETFNTQQNAIYLGALVVRNDANFTDNTTYKILPGGVFRSIGGSGGGGSVVTQTLSGLSDVAISGPTNGQPLVYNTTAGKWVNQSTLIADLTGTATNATTASYISPTFISASAAASGFGSGGGGGDTSGLLTTASFNSYTSSNTSQFAGTASFATTALNLLGSVTTAATASYATNFTIANTLTLDETLTDYAHVNSTIVGSNNLYTQATGSYTSAFVKYTLSSGTNARAGEFVTVWNGTNIVSYDNSTTDIGLTTDIVFSSTIVTGNIQVNATAATSGWKIKTLATFM